MNWWLEINTTVASLVEDPERVRLAFILLLGVFGFFLSLALAMLAGAFFDPVKRRIGSVQEAETDDRATARPHFAILQTIGRYIAPKAEDKKAAVVQRLEHAGFRSPRALTVFFALKLLGFVLVPALLVLVLGLSSSWSVMDWLSPIIFSGVFAFVLPDILLSRAVRARQKRLRHALPDALDLMVVCAEAGLGLIAAIKRVADDIGVQHPELADELQLMIMQTRAGMDNRTALKELERRTGLDDIKAFVTTLLQAMRFGVSIGESLRVFAEDMRDKRLQRAQEIAARLSITMLMPITLCMMPMFLLLIMGPSLLAIIRSFAAVGSGG